MKLAIIALSVIGIALTPVCNAVDFNHLAKLEVNQGSTIVYGICNSTHSESTEIYQIAVDCELRMNGATLSNVTYSDVVDGDPLSGYLTTIPWAMSFQCLFCTRIESEYQNIAGTPYPGQVTGYNKCQWMEPPPNRTGPGQTQ